MIHLLHGRDVDRYFEDPRDARGSRRAFARVRGCKACRRRYERHLLFERVRPDAAPDAGNAWQSRLWETIQTSAAAPETAPVNAATATGSAATADAARAPWLTRPRAAMLVAAFAGVVLVVGLRPSSRVADPVARGGGAEPAAATAPALYLYRNVGGRAERVGGTVRGGDGLLVAYTNPTDLPYLMVFAVDRKAGVHWYYPPYERLGDDPASVSIRTRARGVELGEEIRHALPQGNLQMIALFLPRPRKVLDVERAVADAFERWGADVSTLGDLAGPGGAQVSLPLEVLP